MINISGITLKDALKLKILDTSTVVAGKKGIENIITKVNVMVDQEIVKWIGKGEFILITANHIQSMEKNESASLLREMASKSLSGIGIKLKPYMDELPEAFIKTADELNIPIIVLDYKVGFTELMEVLFKEIFNQQSKVITRVEAVHKDVMNIILKGGGIEDIVRNLAKMINNPIVLKDFHFDELIFHCDGEHKKEYELVQEDLMHTLSIKKDITSAKKTIRYKSVINKETMDVLAVPVIAKNIVCGYIFMYGSREEITNLEVLTLESTAPLMALEFLKRISVQHVENKYKKEFFDDLISKDKNRRNSAFERMNYFNFSGDKHFSVVSVNFPRETDHSEYEEEYIHKIDKALHIIETILRQEMKAYLVTSIKDNVTILMMWQDENGHEKNIRRIVDKIYEELESRVDDADISIGVGRDCLGIQTVYKSLEDSSKAIEASGSYINEKIVYFSNLGIYKIFCHEELTDELKCFFDTTLQPLVAYDRKKDTELVKTLEAYFEVNGNLKKMSELLFTHYNTVLYRVGRIQEITNKNLDNERDRFGLQTAIKIMKILNL